MLLSALMMGLAGSVHCLAMCGPASAAVVRSCGGPRPAQVWAGFHIGRILGYALAGAVAASSVTLLVRLGLWSPVLRPLWVLAHLAALGLGLWLAWTGRQPGWLERIGRTDPRAAAGTAPGWQAIRGPLRGAVVGSIWFAWPCGLLQSALIVAALANGPLAGAAVMAVFALASATALGFGPLLWQRLGRRDPLGGRLSGWVTRLSGVALAGASAWALGHDLWLKVAAYCLT